MARTGEGTEGRSPVQATADRGYPLAEEDELRARGYSLLARLTAAAPDADLLARLGRLAGDGSVLGLALDELAAAARGMAPEALEQEYHDLFIGLGQGELNPYGSYYLTGFLYERPLARLRADMARLGIARQRQVKEPEDHIAALCEMMTGLITGAFARAPAPLVEQRGFFDAHLASWAPRFFADLEAASTARFYRPVGRFGRLFMEIEQKAFAMAA